MCLDTKDKYIKFEGLESISDGEYFYGTDFDKVYKGYKVVAKDEQDRIFPLFHGRHGEIKEGENVIPSEVYGLYVCMNEYDGIFYRAGFHIFADYKSAVLYTSGKFEKIIEVTFKGRHIRATGSQKEGKTVVVSRFNWDGKICSTQ